MSVKTTVSALLISCSCIAFSSDAEAYDLNDKVRIKGDVKFQNITEGHNDLGTLSEETQSDFAIDTRAKLTYKPAKNVKVYVEGRALKVFDGVVGVEDDETGSTSTGSFVELRQFWLRYSELFGNPALGVTVGRQRFRENRAVLWNRDLDAVRLSYDSTLLNGFVAVGQNMASYRTGSDDDDFEEEEQNRLRILGEADVQWKKKQYVSLRVLHEKDTSGTEDIGRAVPTDDRDGEDVQMTWVGARADGHLYAGKESLFKTVDYRADVMAVAGEETLVSTSATADPTVRTVSSVQDRDVMGYGVDMAVNLGLNVPGEPNVLLGYAYGSGDDGTGGTDHAFRQTDLHGNSSYLFPNSSSTIRNYGEVLKPELSNIHIASAGINFPVFDASDVNILYHAYWLDKTQTGGLRSDGLSARLNGQDKFVGQGLDVVANFNIGKELEITHPLLEKTSIRLSAGAFKAGDAWGAGEDETAFRTLAELKVRF